jgi:predicted nucleotidyltransferase
VVTQEIREIINKFVEAVMSRGIHVDKAILYGSYATGKEGEDSDLDVAVISSDFGRDRYKEGTMLMKLAWRIDPRLHPVPFSAESFAHDTWIPLVHEIKTHGVEVH